MESYSSFHNWWESLQRELRLDTIFSLVVFDLDNQQTVDDNQHQQHPHNAADIVPSPVFMGSSRSGSRTVASRSANASSATMTTTTMTTTTTRTTATTRVNVLVPPFDAPARKLGVIPATVLLVTAVTTNPRTWQALWLATTTTTTSTTTSTTSTTTGPGWLVTTLTLAAGAWWSQRALQLLTASVRKSGVISYAEVAWIAYSYRAELVVATWLHVYLLTYLVQQLACISTLLHTGLGRIVVLWLQNEQILSFLPFSLHGALLLLLLLLSVATPTLTIRDVYPLRIVAMISMTCLAIMLTALFALGVVKSVYHNTTTVIIDGDVSTNATTIATNNSDTTAVTTVTATIQTLLALGQGALLAYTPSFVLMLPVHAALHQPTNARVVTVIRQAVWYSFGLLSSITVAMHWVNNNNHWLLGQWSLDSTPAPTLTSYLTAFIQVMAALAILLATVVLMQPCRSNVLECIQRHYANTTVNGEDGCCCDDKHANLFHCDKLHQNCPEECLKDDAETADETVPSFTSQSTTPRMRNNNAYTPVVSSAPAPDTSYYYTTNTYPPPLQIHVARSNTSASELTPLMPSESSSGADGSSGDTSRSSGDASSSSSSNKISRPSLDHKSVPSLSSSEDTQPQRIVTIRSQPRTGPQQEHLQHTYVDEEAAYIGDDNVLTNIRPPCNIDSNRLIRAYSTAFLWVLCYLVAVLGLDNNTNTNNSNSNTNSSDTDNDEGWFARTLSLTEILVSVLITYVLPVACFLKLHPRGRGRR